jgi:hypothetical protein
MLRKFRFVIAGLAIIVANQAVTFAVSAAKPEILLPAGTVGLAVVEAETTISTSSVTAWVDVPGTPTSVNIPTGKTGDMIILFCGEMVADSGLNTRALISGLTTKPPRMTLWHAGTEQAQGRCAIFYRTGVPAGNQLVKMQWHVSSGSATMYNRVMLVIVNIH